MGPSTVVLVIVVDGRRASHSCGGATPGNCGCSNAGHCKVCSKGRIQGSSPLLLYLNASLLSDARVLARALEEEAPFALPPVASSSSSPSESLSSQFLTAAAFFAGTVAKDEEDTGSRICGCATGPEETAAPAEAEEAEEEEEEEEAEEADCEDDGAEDAPSAAVNVPVAVHELNPPPPSS